GNDILISGRTLYNDNTTANHAALDAILAEWTSIDPYNTRWFKIQQGIKLGSNTYGFNQQTVSASSLSSTVSDAPNQSKNQNWFIVSLKDSVTEKNEQVTIINT